MWAFLWIRTESRELHLGFGAAVLALFRKKYPCLLQLNIPTTPNVYEKWLWIKVVCKLSKSTDTNLTQWSLTCLTLSLVLKCLNKWQYEVGWKKQSAFFLANVDFDRGLLWLLFWPVMILTGCFCCLFMKASCGQVARGWLQTSCIFQFEQIHFGNLDK